VAPRRAGGAPAADRAQAGFGLLAASSGYAAAFASTGALMLAALLPAWRLRSSSKDR
jgi:hypothetical protein